MCIQTIWIRKHQQEVPCGRCYECVKRRRNDWYIRCLIESRSRKFTYFGLLTYAKVGDKLIKRDVQLFLKRLRSYGFVFSYLIVGEHGERRDRPHWHCLFFSDVPISYQRISQAWRGGFKLESPHVSGWVRFEQIRSTRSIRYTVKYIYKYDGVDPRFSMLVSKNPAIGHKFLVNQVNFLERRSADFSIDGRRVALPRYYKRKFFDDYPDIKEEVNSGLAAKVAEISESELDQAFALYPDTPVDKVLSLVKKSKLLFNEQFQRSGR